ncbi:Intramolecular chaperone auto-processing domain containing protein [uncultured Caudovirales phage]|uniref:Intramolecular chaperone auto-processing domain containing protein n=1 Tax=uncultured Caudovirales phage TaxID=2100421 RepID=A0A6J5KN87_9CAUD|nr:Intramolecular chaperone auto-processing domain containing protein [uncultured Caudovirales phage]
MTSPSNSAVQNLLPVQAYFDTDNNFITFIGQGEPFYASVDPSQSGLNITNSTINSTTIGLTTPAAAAFTNISTVTGTISTAATGPTDIVNKQYVDYFAAGLSWKAPAITATTANITLSGLQTVGGVTVVDGDTVLVKNQSNAAENGIYVAHSGAWTYAIGGDTWSEYVGAIIFVVEGALTGTAWYCTAQPGGTLGVTNMVWSNFSVASSYTAGTGLQLIGTQFSIANTAATAGTYGSASRTITQTVNAQGQITNIFDQPIDIAASQIGSGTIDTARINGSYTGITGVGTLVAGTWNAGTIGVAYGGTGAVTLTGYVKGAGTTAFTASSTIPTTDLSGTITNAQLANSTISGVALGSNLFNLTAGSNVTFSSGTTYNGSAAITINASSTMVYPGAGIPNSTGSAWGTSYSTTGSGTVVALATSPVFTTPSLGVASATSLAVTAAALTSSNTSSLGVGGTLGFSDTGIIAHEVASTNSYLQHVIQNTNAGAAASAEFIAYNNAGTASTNYACVGINSSAYTGTGSINAAGYGYFLTGSTDLVIGTIGANSVHITTNSQATDAITINTSNAVAFNGSYGTAGYLLQSNSSATANSWVNPATLTVSAASTATTATNATNTAITDDTTTATTCYPTWVTTTSGNLPQKVASTKLSFVPSTGVLSATTFSGAGTSLTGTGSSFTAGTANALATGNNYQVNSLGVGTAASGTAGEIRATNNVTAYYSSDIKFKENVRVIDNAIEKASIIGGKYFDWTDEYINSKGGADGYFVRKNDIGVIAQDVQKVLPEAVRTREDGSLAVDYQKLVSLAFAAIAELKAEINELKGR